MLRRNKTLLLACAVLIAILPALPSWAAEEELSSFAFVRDDGTLQVSGYLVHLYGIYIPPTDQSCLTFIRPVPCASRASLALDFKISGDFVRCKPFTTNPDGSITANCTSGGTDLSQWMLQNGWALALPDAPFAYVALERIAQSRGLGVWGMPVQSHSKRPHLPR